MKPFSQWPIVRTILGKNGAGQKLNQLLPFKATREAIAAGLRGVADLSPTPNDKDANIREKAQKIYSITKSVKLDQVQGAAVDALTEIHDLLDDGLLNDSAVLSPETTKKIRVLTSYGFFAWMAYEGIAVLVGWPSVLQYALIIYGV